MICKNCKTDNKDGALYCVNCGYELTSKSPAFRKLFVLISAILAMLIIGLFYFSASNNKSTQEKTEEIISSLKKARPENKSSTSIKDKNSSGFIKMKLIFADGKIESSDSYISAENLIAIPIDKLQNITTIKCFDSVGDIDINQCRWNIDNPILFLTFPIKSRLANKATTALPIEKWNPDLPLERLTSENASERQINSHKIIEKKGDFLIVKPNDPENIDSCILIQQNKLKGWVFSNQGKNLAYLYLGEKRISPSQEPSISMFLISLILGDNSNRINKIKSLPPQKLASDFSEIINFILETNTKDKNLLRNFSGVIELFISCLKENGMIRTIADHLDLKLTALLENKSILESLAWSNISIYGYGKAIKQIHQIISMQESSFSFDNQAFELIENLYSDWIKSTIMNSNNPNDALIIYNLASKDFPKSQKIKILGAEIYLQLNNPNEAERILNSETFEPKYKQSIDELRKLISDIKSKMGKIVIKFEPNASNNIFLDAVLNDSVRQKFIVDTGASLVTIPSATARKLRLNLSNAQTRPISTASGIYMAKEVKIDSISINGNKVSDIPAVIIDLPDDDGLGLLGMSFLNAFRIEINNNSSELLLTPREI